MRRTLCAIVCVAVLAGAVLAPGPFATRGAAQERNREKRWVYVSTNLSLDENVPKLESLFRRAKEAGYNGVVLSDTKTLTWWLLDTAARWKANAAKVRSRATGLDLELVVCVFPFGYAESFLAHDPNLAAGMPIKDAPLVRRGDRLIPRETARIANGSFETYKGNRAAAFGLQDDPGEGSFIDTKIFKDAHASLRFENPGAANEHGLGRVFQRVAVKPWQQYRIRAWMKTEHLTADMVQIIVLASRTQLQYQNLEIPGDRGFTYIDGAKDLTTDWVEQSVTFNSLGNSSVIIGAGVWGAAGGTIWWDDLRIDAVPALNVLRRGTLPLAVTGERGVVYAEGKDFNRVEDPGLGRSRWPGTYDTRHEPPQLGVPPGSRIREGERLRLSCYHAAIFYSGQVACTLDDDRVFELCSEQIARTEEALSPDGYFLQHDEIRCAGWEPSQEKNFHRSGGLFAFNIRRCYEIARDKGGAKPVYVWSDMYDPHHNARPGYYLVNGSISKSWEGLDPNVIVMKWGLPEKAARSLEFFANRGNRLMIAAFYDENVEKNHAAWARAIEGAPQLDGVMYTTWRGDYSKLEEFAKVWWGQ